MRDTLAPSLFRNRRLLYVAAITAALLLIPLIAMQFTTQIIWTPSDFVVAAVLLFGAGAAYELVTRRARTSLYRVAVGLAVTSGLLLTWANLAVGIIGSEDNPVNRLYFAVVAIGLVGAAIARLRPRGMARAMLVTAAAQALVPAVALWLWKPPLGFGSAGVTGVIALDWFFAALWVLSALLFSRAAGTQPSPTRA